MKEVNRVDTLTKSQEKAMIKYRDRWIEQGLKTGETDWKTFDKYMPACYEKAGLKYPKNVVRVSSPLVGALSASIAEAILLKKRGAVGGAVRDAVGDAVGGAVGDAVRDAVGGAVRSAVRGAVGDAVRDAVGGAVGGSVGIIKKLGLNIGWHYWLGGQFWVGGLYWGTSFVSFFFDICKLKLSKDIMERALAYRKICESVNYIWPNRDFVIVCSRPIRISRDKNGRLHSLTEKAIEYPDGYGLYMIHGVKFTEEQFNKAKKASLSDIIGWEDIDQRSALLRDKPIESLIKKVDKKLIDETKECGGYKLYEIELKGIGKARFLSYKSWSSKKMYAKFVPLKSEKCLDTVASLRHQTVEELITSFKS